MKSYKITMTSGKYVHLNFNGGLEEFTGFLAESTFIYTDMAILNVRHIEYVQEEQQCH